MERKRASAKLHRLTVREVQAAGDGDHTDGGGLLLRVRGPSSSWVLRYTGPAGKRREMGLGAAHRSNASLSGDSLTLARRLAHEAREQLQRGIDPIDARDQSRTAARDDDERQRAERAREQQTLARVARDYHERVIEPSRTDKHAAQWIASLENHVPGSVWHKAIADITAPELLAALLAMRSLEEKGKAIPETLQRVRQRLDAVFEDAIFHGRCTLNPAAAIRRKMQEAQGRRERGEFAALPYRDAPLFLADLREQQGIAARCLEFALLTASRTGEVIGATWAELDLDAGLWIVPGARVKGGEAHTVYLSAPALALLEGQKRLGVALVFPSPLLGDDPRPLSNMAMLTLLGRMGLRDRTTVHGVCRSTFSTWANETGAARPDVIEACLAHRESDKVRAAYNRAEFMSERRALLDAWAGFLSNPPASNVVPLKAA